MTYRAYLRTFDGKIIEKTITTDQEEASKVFSDLVNRTDLDGQKLLAALSFQSINIAYHRFDRQPGNTQYWRDRLNEIEWPKKGTLH